MSSKIIKKQSSLTLIVLMLTTLMIAGSIFSSSSDNVVFAKKDKQSIGQFNEQKQKAVCLTAGANSPVSISCNNDARAENTNGGGNVKASSGSGYHQVSDQKIGQHNKQKQKAVCLTAGANSPLSTSCNNGATEANANGGGNVKADDSHFLLPF